MVESDVSLWVLEEEGGGGEGGGTDVIRGGKKKKRFDVPPKGTKKKNFSLSADAERGVDGFETTDER